MAITFPDLLDPLHICVAALLCGLGSLLDSLYSSSPADCPMQAFAHSPVYAFNTCSSLQSRARQEGVAWDSKSADVQGNVTAPRGSKALVIEGPVCMLADRATEPAHGQSSGLLRHGSVTKQSQQQLFIPSNVTLDVERRLHVSSTTKSPHRFLLPTGVVCSLGLLTLTVDLFQCISMTSNLLQSSYLHQYVTTVIPGLVVIDCMT